MDPTMKAGLQGQVVTLFTSVALIYPTFEVRLLDQGFVTFGGHTYTGRDATYGALDSLEEVEEGANEQAPRTRIGLLPPTKEAMEDLTDPEAQMKAQVIVSVGVADRETGLVVGTPETLFVGFVDTADFGIRSDGWGVTLDCCSEIDRALDSGEGYRLAPGFHRSIWSGEAGLDFVTGIDDPVYWGIDGPKGSITVMAGGGSSGNGSSSRPSTPTSRA